MSFYLITAEVILDSSVRRLVKIGLFGQYQADKAINAINNYYKKEDPYATVIVLIKHFREISAGQFQEESKEWLTTVV